MAKRNQFTPPTRNEVYIYFRLLNLSDKHSDAFYLYYEFKEWRNDTGEQFKNWKVLAYNWILSFARSNPFKKKRSNGAKIAGHLFPIK
ncbi:hypothetical protein DXN04_14355 [Chitinophaga silvisoli]|uniref:Transposase n=1 Tax=Chitinophaga silvisoli TaxID=2291814 RepID=A0A3E1P2N8_9BACT|nr:hypothetical protein DXN04_14355 [Chitinophaga silvisoli]